MCYLGLEMEFKEGKKCQKFDVHRLIIDTDVVYLMICACVRWSKYTTH